MKNEAYTATYCHTAIYQQKLNVVVRFYWCTVYDKLRMRQRVYVFPYGQYIVGIYVRVGRKSSQRALDELQRTIMDVETKYKAEIGRLKKKHESDVRELEVQVESLNRNNAELSKANKSLAARIKVTDLKLH